MSVRKGDITNEPVDVIVNASDRFLNHAGGVAKVIVNKGGKIIENESREIIRKRGSLRDGEVVATEAGNLPCRVVVHAVGPNWSAQRAKKCKQTLYRAYLNSLLEAQKRNMTSTALPAIGSGNCRMPIDMCAEVMCDAVDEFIRQGNFQKKTVTDIRFVNTDYPSVLAFSKKLKMRFRDDSVKHISEGISATSLPSRAETNYSSKTNYSNNVETHSPSKQSPYSPCDNKSVFGQSSPQSDSFALAFANTMKMNAPGNDASDPVSQHPLGTTSAAAIHSHPLSSPSQTSPPGASYSNALRKKITAGSYACPPRTQQLAASGGKRGSEEEGRLFPCYRA